MDDGHADSLNVGLRHLQAHQLAEATLCFRQAIASVPSDGRFIGARVALHVQQPVRP